MEPFFPPCDTLTDTLSFYQPFISFNYYLNSFNKVCLSRTAMNMIADDDYENGPFMKVSINFSLFHRENERKSFNLMNALLFHLIALLCEAILFMLTLWIKSFYGEFVISTGSL